MARTVVGIPLYNGGEHVEQALRSLFEQTDGDVAFVLADDGSTDGTAELAEALAADEPRAFFERNPDRLGLIGNWRRVHARARELHPDARYFAWGSDHDVWLPRWLEALRSALQESPEAVLAYPLMARIVDGEVRTRTGPRILDTRGVESPLGRLGATARNAAAGSMVYGLFRADALERAGVLRRVLAPDRLLLLELALQGPFVHVQEVLWQRRFAHEVTAARHRRTLFAGRAPFHAWLPEWTTHAVVLGVQHGPAAGAAYPVLRIARGLDARRSRARKSAHRLARRLG